MNSWANTSQSDERNQREQHKERSLAESFKVLREISLAMTSGRDPKQILKQIADRALSVLPTDVVVVFLRNEDSNTLEGAVASTSLGDEGVRRLEEAYGAPFTEVKFPLKRGRALIVDAVLGGKPRFGLNFARLKVMTRFSGIRPLLDTAEEIFGARTVSIVPLIARERSEGVMLFLSPKKITPSERDLIEAFASQAAVVIENARLYEMAKSERDKLTAIMAGMEDGVDVVSKDYIVKFQNRVLVERFGDLTGQLCYKGYMGLEEPCEFCPMVKAIETDKPHRVQLVGKDGRDYELISMPLRNPDGTVDAIEIVRDITKGIRAGEALRESREKFKAQYKGIPVPTYTWQRVGEDFVLVDYNDAAEAITRGNVVGFVGRTASEMYRDRPDILEELSRCFTERTTIKREMEYRFTTTGESRDLTVSYVFVPRDLVMVHTEDITERKWVEREIEERRLYLEGVLTAAPDAIVTLDSRHRIVEWNSGAERLFGYSQEEVIGRSLDHLVTNPDTHEEAVGFTQMVMNGKDVPPVETVRYRKDGSPVNVILAGSPVLVRDQLIGVVAVYTDITERKRAEEQLSRSVEETAHGQRLLLALSQAAQAVQRARTPDEVYRTVGDEIARLGYDAAIFTLTDDRANLTLSHLTFQSAALQAAENLSGLSAQYYRFPLVPGGFFHRIITEGEATFSEPMAQPMSEALPESVRPLAGQVAALLGLEQSIHAPLTVEGETHGLLVVTGTGLTEADMPAMTAFANQAAIAIENARLYEKEQHRRQETETLRQAAQALSATLDLQEVFESILSELQRMVPYDSASVQLLKGDRLEIIGGHGFPNLDELLGISFPVEGDNPNRLVMASRAPFIVEDAPAVYSNFRQEPHAQAGIRAWLGVPLLFGDRLVGMIALDKKVPGFYTEEHARLALAFAAQAAVAIENARLYEEVQARTKYLATLLQINATLRSTLPLSQVLKTIVQGTGEALGYASSVIAVPDAKMERLVLGAVGGGRVLDAALKLTGVKLESFSLPLQAEENPIIQAYLTGELQAWSRAPERIVMGVEPPISPKLARAMERTMGTILAACVPLQVAEKRVGVLTVFSPREQLPDEEQEMLLGLADQAALAMENARLYEETQRRLRALQMLHQASESIVSTLELDKALQLIMDSAVKAIPSAQKGSLHLLDEERNELVMRAGYGFSPEVMKAATFKVGEGYAWWALAHNQPVIIDNVTTDARFKPIDLPEVHEEKSAICAPLVVKGKTIGTITLDNVTSYRAFDEDDLQLLSAFADQAAIAIENARLFEETKRLAATDPLTGVWNRRHIEERLRTEVARARRYHHPLSVLVMDIDNLKLFNDTHGHLAGDEVIRTVAQVVLTSCREIDIVGRYGGDEFAVILPEADARGAAIVARRILAALRKEPFYAPDETKVPISISIGAASYPSDSDEADRLFSLADAAMYRAKVAGGGQFASLTVGPEEVPEELAAPFDVLQGLLVAVDSKDRYTFKHSQEVTKYALALARAGGLSQEEMRALEIAGKFHDVGKIGIPTNILRKPGPLGREAWEIVRLHPRLGYLILQQLPQMEPMLEAVLHHHELYDGTGYPDGLKGAEIPLLARILAVADAFSAMTTDRPYRKALKVEEILDELQLNAGKQFDPDLTQKFIELVEKGEIE